MTLEPASFVSMDSSPVLSQKSSLTQSLEDVHPVDLRSHQTPDLELSLQISLKELADVKFALDQSSIVAMTDHKGAITYVNDKFCEISKYSRAELIGQTHRIVNSGHHPKEFFVQMWVTIASGQVWKGEIKNRAKDGTAYWVDTTIVPFLDEHGKPYQHVAIRTDITHRKQLEEELRLVNEQLEGRVEQRTEELRRQTRELAATLQELQKAQMHLVQSEKMSSLGQLVAGVAHEINNPVNFIYGNLNHAHDYTQDLSRVLALYQQHHFPPHPVVAAEMAAIDLDFLMEDLPKLLDSMKVGADRIKVIVASLRTFSRMDEADMKEVNIHEGLDSTLMILQNRLKARPEHPGIQVIKDYGSLPLVECYAGQLNQVFMNVLNNAIDALEEPGSQQGRAFGQRGEAITIHTEQVTGDRICISISDNGPGIPDAIQHRLFEPFFTTKPVGKGTGMGLSISYQIVTEWHGGSFQCRSRPGEGTEFIITIPIRQP